MFFAPRHSSHRALSTLRRLMPAVFVITPLSMHIRRQVFFCRETPMPRNTQPKRTSSHRILHVLFFTFRRPLRGTLLPLLLLPRSYVSSSTWIAVLIASSKTSATPLCSLALHSIYVAPIRSATACPCSGVTGVRPCVRRSSMHVRLFRRSDLRPTKTRGVVGQKCRTSGYHCGGQSRYSYGERKSYLVHDVLERVGAIDSKADEKQIRFGVRKRSQTVVLFLPCCIPQRKFNRLS